MSPEQFAELNTNPAEMHELRELLHRAIAQQTQVLAVCYGKRSFAGPVEASRAIRHPGIGSYRCNWCGHWHIGSNNHPRRLAGKLRIKRGAPA